MPDGSPHSSAKNVTQQLSRDSDFLQSQLLLELMLTLKDTHIFSSAPSDLCVFKGRMLKSWSQRLRKWVFWRTLCSLDCGVQHSLSTQGSLWLPYSSWQDHEQQHHPPRPWQRTENPQQAFTTHLHKVPWEIGILVFMFFFKSGGPERPRQPCPYIQKA